MVSHVDVTVFKFEEQCWTFMDAHFWMDVHGRLWTLIFGWTFMDVHGRSWTLMDAHGRSWTLMDAHGRSWTLMDAHGRSWTLSERFPLIPKRYCVLTRTFLTVCMNVP
jgi:hypothetical protein